MDSNEIMEVLAFAATFFRAREKMAAPGPGKTKLIECEAACQQAIKMLDAQTPVEPTLDIRHGKSMWRCGSCSTALQPNQIHTKFCFNCGQAVKWE